MEYAYKESYKNIPFVLTKKGYWVFQKHINQYWSRFNTDEEAIEMKKGVTVERGAELMRIAIDRYLKWQPCYSGDIKDRWEISKYHNEYYELLRKARETKRLQKKIRG